MKKMLTWAIATGAIGLSLGLFCAAPVHAEQAQLPRICNPSRVLCVQAQPVQNVDNAGNLSTASGGGGGGGGTSDASAANQASQILIEQAIRDRIGDSVTSPTANTLADRLKTLAAKLDSLISAQSSLFQSGGSIGNTSFQVSNFPTSFGISSLPALAAGANTIGSIGNTQFGAVQVGTWNVGNITGNISLPTGAATAANQSTAQTSLTTIATNTTAFAAIGGTPSDAAWSGSGNATMISLLKALLTQTASTAVTPVSMDHTIPGTTDAVVVSSSALPTGASTSALQTTGNTSLGTIATNTTGLATAAAQTTMNTTMSSILTQQNAQVASIGTIGSGFPTTAQAIEVKNPNGNGVGILAGGNGGLLPGQASTVSTRTTLTASTATVIDTGHSTRLLSTVQFDGSPTAAVYLCWSQTTTCSATNYDIKVASGAADATTYTAPFGTSAVIYAYTTGTGIVLNTVSWLPL